MKKSTIAFDVNIGPKGSFPFSLLADTDIKEAFLKGFRLDDEEIETIAEDTEPATFENVIVAFERSGKYLSEVESVFYNLLSMKSDDKMQALAEEISPLEEKHFSDIYQNEKLFARVKTVYEGRGNLELTKEEDRLLEKTYDAFKSRGVDLDADKRKEFNDINEKISVLNLKFSKNLLDCTNAYSLVVEEDKLSGMPKIFVDAARAKAEEKGSSGCMFDLSFPSYCAFMNYCPDRGLRKQMYIARCSRCYGGEFDNVENVIQIANLRLSAAKLLGYKDYASEALIHRMAKTEDEVTAFLGELLDKSIGKARADVAELEDYAKKCNDQDFNFMPWDFGFYSEKLEEEKFNVNEEVTRPYFEFNRVRTAIFGLATKLYGITFRKDTTIDVYDPEVEVYEVGDSDGTYLGLLYVDPFPRSDKQGGAWMTEFKGQYIDEKGTDQRPHIAIVMNLTRPTGDTPSLLSLDEVSTLIHEFGHALHGLLSKCTYECLSGTNVYRDFVELPSQVMENWAGESEFLNLFAKHYQTGELIPGDVLSNILKSSTFLSGYDMVRQLGFCYIDMAWHTLKESINLSKEDFEDFERKASSKTEVLPIVGGCVMSTSFSHIFDGGYAAGYYSYKWAEVLDADAFALFKEKGIFNTEVSGAFRRCILEKGGSEDPMDLYVAFRGKKPSVEYLLRRNEIIK